MPLNCRPRWSEQASGTNLYTTPARKLLMRRVTQVSRYAYSDCSHHREPRAQAIIRAIADQARTIRLPVHIASLFLDAVAKMTLFGFGMPLDGPAGSPALFGDHGTRKAPQGNRCTMPPAWSPKTKIPDKKLKEKPPVLASRVSPPR